MPHSDEPDLLAVEVDITEAETAQRVVDRALERSRRINRLINNTGVFIGKRIEDKWRLDELVAVPHFDGLMAGEPDALVESCAAEPELHDLGAENSSGTNGTRQASHTPPSPGGSIYGPPVPRGRVSLSVQSQPL